MPKRLPLFGPVSWSVPQATQPFRVEVRKAPLRARSRHGGPSLGRWEPGGRHDFGQSAQTGSQDTSPKNSAALTGVHRRRERVQNPLTTSPRPAL
jgi:hypothetical protein